jgi:cob(I)alamin adenosyltransferase
MIFFSLIGMKQRSRITTLTGDGGKTRLFSGEEVPKTCRRTEAYGDLDELNAVLGIARLQAEGEARDQIFSLQRELFVVGAELATTTGGLDLLPQRADAEMVKRLELLSLDLEKRVTMPRGFVVPGGTPAAAYIDLARTVARRCERKVVALRDEGEIDNPHLLIWFNRLSDYLWLLARFVEHGSSLIKDDLP